MAKAKLHNGMVLEFDDELTDEQIDEAVAKYIANIKAVELNNALFAIKDAIVQTGAASIATLKTTSEAVVNATTAPRETVLVAGADGKPSKSVTTLQQTIFE
jgi:hypothetical protein